jgi:hypothetical protein
MGNKSGGPSLSFASGRFQQLTLRKAAGSAVSISALKALSQSDVTADTLLGEAGVG